MKTASEFELYDRLSIQTSKSITKAYSTSFSLGIRLFAKELRDPIYSIYGFVRLADEIVDSWHSLDQRLELDHLSQDCAEAVKSGFSANPVLHAFAKVVRTYNIDYYLVEAFLASMYLDLTQKTYSKEEYATYIYGSAEVVGLMCLSIFSEGDKAEYVRLLPGARSLGAAFQKVNFLRDLGEDSDGLGRTYFPGIDSNTFNENDKQRLVLEIEADFKAANVAIFELPKSAQMGVRLAYVYYQKLLEQIKTTPAEQLKTQRIRVSGGKKLSLLAKTYTKERLLKR